MKIHIFLSLFLAFLTATTVFGCGGGGGGGGDDGDGGGGDGGSTSIDTIRENIASTAEKYVGSTHWCYECPSGHGVDTNKCNYFVYDVGIEAGADMPAPKRSGGPVGAGEGGWGEASSLDYWERVSSPQRGDMVGAHRNNVYHVGIYVAHETTVSATDENVRRMSWPYSGGYSGIVYWRYTG